MSPAAIMRLPRRNFSIDEFVALGKRDGVKFSRSRIANLPNGEWLCVWKNPRNKKMYRVHLQKIFIKKFAMKYRVNHAKGYISKGKKHKADYELLITPFRMPRGLVIGKRRPLTVRSQSSSGE